MTYLSPELDKIATDLEKRERFEIYEQYNQKEDSGWEETSEEVIDEMLETFDVIVCSHCRTEYSFLTAEWADGDCICPNCNRSTGDSQYE